MKDMLEVAPLEFTADVAGALEETRVSGPVARVITEVISAAAKILTA